MPSGVKEDSTTRDIDSLSRSRVQNAPPADEFPLQVQLQLISPVPSTISADRIAPRRSSQKLVGIHELFPYRCQD
jgi:hypothetical protein